MTNRNGSIPLKTATDRYNTVVTESRSPNTARAYAQATAKFLDLLGDRNVNPDTAPIKSANETWLIDFIGSLRDHSPATEQLYLTAVVGFYEFLASEYGLDVNLARVRALVRRRQRRVPPKLPEFPRRDVESVITCVEAAASDSCKDDREKLRNLRFCLALVQFLIYQVGHRGPGLTFFVSAIIQDQCTTTLADKLLGYFTRRVRVDRRRR